MTGSETSEDITLGSLDGAVDLISDSGSGDRKAVEGGGDDAYDVEAKSSSDSSWKDGGTGAGRETVRLGGRGLRGLSIGMGEVGGRFENIPSILRDDRDLVGVVWPMSMSRASLCRSASPQPLAESWGMMGGVDGSVSSGLVVPRKPSSSEQRDGVVMSVSVTDIAGHVRFAGCRASDIDDVRLIDDKELWFIRLRTAGPRIEFSQWTRDTKESFLR
jgi:hypothetical protein